MKKILPVLSSIFAVIGIISVGIILSEVITSTPGTGWSWSEENRIQNNSSYVTIERGKHDEASDRVRVVLFVDGKSRELWSSYMASEPLVTWVNANTISISYLKEESHSYWPQVSFGEDAYNVTLSYK